MPFVKANGIDIAYEEFGEARAPAILLIMGLGTQLIAWPEPFCKGLADRGFRVIRYDNRDVGLSTKIEGGPPPDLGAVFGNLMAGKPVATPYKLADMAQDAVGLLDGLGIAKAHVVGASMGGMIGQLVAADFPQRTRSLVSIMSTTGDPSVPQGKPEAMAVLMGPRPDPKDREAVIMHMMNTLRVIGSPGYPFEEAELRTRVELAIDRSYYAAGLARQLVAILASGSRVEALKRITVPTLVIHGADDPLVPVEGGRHTAAQIAGARLEIIPGMGHDLPTQLLPQLVELIATHCTEADRLKMAS
jgi:pimeloyl-ACP methyl ester carboxylesterase